VLETKKQYKVISPMEGQDNKTWWMRVGNAFPNKDGSINVYIDAMPKSMKFQIRELSEQEIRERDEKRAHYAKRDSSGDASLAANGATAPHPGSSALSYGGGASGRQDDIPF
jgi:hypothetical protein